MAQEIRRRLTEQRVQIHAALTRLEALSGYRLAVVDGSSGAAYAQANSTKDHFIVCNTLTAAFHAEESLGQPTDLIVGSAPVLTWMARHHQKEWTVVTIDGEQPLLLTHEHLSIVAGEDRLYLLWFLNNLLFELDDSGELLRLRQRWLDDSYDERLRAPEAGLPVTEAAKAQQARRHCYIGHAGFGRLRALGRE